MDPKGTSLFTKLFLLNLIWEWIVSWITDKHIKVNKSREFRVTRNYWYSSCERLFQVSWYPFAKKLSSVRMALAIRLKKKCHSFNYSGCPFAQNCYPFERLADRISVRRKLSSIRTARAIPSKLLSGALVFQNTFTRAVCVGPVKK